MVKVYFKDGRMTQFDANGEDAVYYSDSNVLKITAKDGTVSLINWEGVLFVEGIDSYE